VAGCAYRTRPGAAWRVRLRNSPTQSVPARSRQKSRPSIDLTREGNSMAGLCQSGFRAVHRTFPVEGPERLSKLPSISSKSSSAFVTPDR
jgi:hypothetical protein